MKSMVFNRKNSPVVFRQLKNLGQLIQWIESEGEKEDLFIVKMSLNGKNMDEDEENLLESLSINEVEEIAVEMAPIEEIMSQTMGTIIGAIQDI
ncbi:MAG: hypothetical protein HRT44_13915, partial [Bdellovibrionales bacterium]|nr:hypothetical protein [Bdellovibrionales bacterium]